MSDLEFEILHLFAGIGGGALGTAASGTRFGDHSARFRLVGGVDNDPASCRDFERLTGAPALLADLHTLQPADLLRFCPKMPHAVLLSPPCKGFSRLLSTERSKLPKYEKLNRLLVDGLFLLCSTWAEPPPMIFVENVPGIMTRGGEIVRQAEAMLRAHGYALHYGTHNCGEIGHLGQSRPRWFMVARCQRRVPQFVYQPPKLGMRSCGSVIGPLPIPGDPASGPLHALPRISWRTWVRLALIPAGGDWRDLPGVIPEGKKRREVHRRDKVVSWSAEIPAVTGPGGAAVNNVADPRVVEFVAMSHGKNFSGSPGLLGVDDWAKPAPVVSGSARVTGSNMPASIADPRGANWRPDTMRVLTWEEAARTITGSLSIDNGASAIADPRLEGGRPTDISAPLDPDKPPPFTPLIIAEDGTWHRPLTTLELAALQGFRVDAAELGQSFTLDGSSNTRWREAIGNAIPPPAAAAIGDQLLRALLISKLEKFALSHGEIWVTPDRDAA